MARPDGSGFSHPVVAHGLFDVPAGKTVVVELQPTLFGLRVIPRSTGDPSFKVTGTLRSSGSAPVSTPVYL